MKYVVAVVFAMILLAGGRVFADAPQKPNIIFVLADDLGIDGVSAYGGETHQTPPPLCSWIKSPAARVAPKTRVNPLSSAPFVR